MSDPRPSTLASRRVVLKAAGCALALAALPRAFARMPLLRGTEDDAVALQFTSDASRLDPSTQPLFQPGSRCARCFFYQGDADSRTAPCTVFAGWEVPATGWCKEFSAR